MEKGSSPLDTLRQLRELLDAGTITPQEFETLKARLLAEQLAAPVVPPAAVIPPAAPATPPTVPLNPTFTTPPVTPTDPVRSEPATTPPVSPAPGPVEELPPLLDFFKQPQTSGSATPPPVAPVREEKPASYTAPYTPPPPPAPAAPTAAPDFFPPRPAPPPAPPTPRETPQFYPPAPSTPPPAAAPPEFFPPKTQATVPAEPIRSVVPPVPPTPVNPPRRAAEPLDDDEEVAEAPTKSPLGLILAIGGGLLLLALIWYLVAGQSRSSEHLTSISQTAADTVAVAPETGPQAEQLDLPPAAAPETVRVAPVIPPVAAPDSAAPSTATGSNPAENQAAPPASAAATPETTTAASASEATDRIRDVLAAYYADIQAAPFNAEQYFAPQVELFVILRNTTPAAINTWLEQNRFTELKDAQFQVEPGSLRVSPPTTDGSRVVTYIERGRGFRQSLQKNQYIRAQMRLRLNPDYKITYQKQERLLENTLSDPPTATTPSTTPATE